MISLKLFFSSAKVFQMSSSGNSRVKENWKGLTINISAASLGFRFLFLWHFSSFKSLPHPFFCWVKVKIKPWAKGLEEAPLASWLSRKTMSPSFFLHPHPGHGFFDLHWILWKNRVGKRLNFVVSHRMPTLERVKMGIHNT